MLIRSYFGFISSKRNQVHRFHNANQSMMSGDNMGLASEAPDPTVHPGNPTTDTNQRKSVLLVLLLFALLQQTRLQVILSLQILLINM